MHPIRCFLAGVMLATWPALDPAAAEASRSTGSTIGKPFRVSDSVNRYCAMRPIAPMCAAFEPLLEEFLAESRDAKWAVPMEALIEKSMLVNGKPWVEIRALECRRTRCAFEYAVSIDDLDHEVDESPELDRLMEPLTGVVAPELPSDSGKGKMVTVLIWHKRP